MKKGKTGPKDLEGPFETMKKFKTEFPETENDIAFKTSYTRLRKFVKKLKKIYEVESKAKKSQKELTQDQKDMIETRRDNELLFEEVLLFCNSYMEEYRKKESDASARTLAEEQKTLQIQESVKIEATPQPQVDVDAIRHEGYVRGHGEGKQEGFKSGRSEGFEEGRTAGYEQAIRENPPQEQQDSVDVFRKAAKYSTLLMVLPSWINGMTFYDPSFKLSDYFSNSEINSLKEMYMPTQPYFSTGFKIEKLEEAGVLEAFDRAVQNAKLMTYVQQTMPFTQAYMINFGAYNPNIASMMGGASIIQSTPQTFVSAPVEVSKPVTKSVQQEQPRTQTATITSVVFDSETVDQEVQEEAKVEETHEDPVVSQDHANEIWNQPEDEDDEEDEEHPEHDSGDENKENQENKETQDNKVQEEQFFEEDGHKKGYRGQRNYHDKNINSRYRGGPRGAGRGSGRYRAHYNDYNPKDYYGYDQHYSHPANQYQGHFGYSNYQKEDQYYGGGEEGDQHHEKRDYYNKPHRGGRGGPRRGARGSERGGKFEEHHQQVPSKQEEPKIDADGFEIVSKKTYVMPKNKGKKKRTPQPQQN